MSDFTDKVIGVYHFLSDKPPKNMPIVPPRSRSINPWLRNGQALVAKVITGDNVQQAIHNAIASLGSLSQIISRGDRVLVKPNFNSPDPFPASTDRVFLRAIIEILLEAGARVTIGESAGGIWRPSENVFRKLGILELVGKLGVELIIFENKTTDWVKIRIDGTYLSTVTMPRAAYEADKIVYLPCMKTHRLAGFSGAIKLAFGFVNPGERRGLHLSHLQQKIAEVSLCWQPDLIIMDGRKAFISGGPDKGRMVKPGLILASGDLIAIDVEAIKVLLTYKAKNKLTANPYELPQIVIALKHGLGLRKNGYIVEE